jgi:hypothetical protein
MIILIVLPRSRLHTFSVFVLLFRLKSACSQVEFKGVCRIWYVLVKERWWSGLIKKQFSLELGNTGRSISVS